MQITFIATTAAIGVEDEVVTTDKVQVLPSWAPLIEYIADNTTGPWLAMLSKPSTGDLMVNKHVQVYAYGRKDELHDGADCVTLSRAVTATATKKAFLTLSYQAVGELSRP